MKKIINWFKQYGYYYKYAFITIILAVALLTVGFVSCLSKTEYDLTVILSGDFYIYDTEVAAYEMTLANYIEDYNGDGKTNVQVMGLSTNSGNAELNYSYTQRLQAEIMTGEVLLFIVDQPKYDSLKEAGAVGNAEKYLPQGYDQTDYFDLTDSKFVDKVMENYRMLCEGGQTPTVVQDGLRMFIRTAPDNASENEEYMEKYERTANVLKQIAAESQE